MILFNVPEAKVSPDLVNGTLPGGRLRAHSSDGFPFVV